MDSCVVGSTKMANQKNAHLEIVLQILIFAIIIISLPGSLHVFKSLFHLFLFHFCLFVNPQLSLLILFDKHYFPLGNEENEKINQL